MTRILAGLLLAVAASAQVQAGIIAPPDLLPGDWYSIVFVTAGTTKATSSSIATYDAFAQAQANLNPELAHGSYFQALAMAGDSTYIPADDYPHYNTLGQHLNWTPNPYTYGHILVNPEGPNLLNPLIYDQFGVASHTLGSPVWTGIDSTNSTPRRLGSLFSAEIGTLGALSFEAFDNGQSRSTSQLHPIYAIGSVMVPYPTPEPSTLVLLSCATATLVGTRLLRRRNAISSNTKTHSR